MTPYPIELREVAEAPILAIAARASRANLSQTIRRLFDQFYAAPPPGPRGLNIVVYRNDPDQNLLVTPEGCPIECGVQIPAPVEGCRYTPAGTVATTPHFGPYEKLGGAYDAIFAWCRENRRQPAGPCWEVYGHWSDDPAMLRTDVFCLLKDAV